MTERNNCESRKSRTGNVAVIAMKFKVSEFEHKISEAAYLLS